MGKLSENPAVIARNSMILGLRFRILREYLVLNRKMFCAELQIGECSYKNLENAYRNINYGYCKMVFDRIFNSPMVIHRAPPFYTQLWGWINGVGEIEDLELWSHAFVKSSHDDIRKVPKETISYAEYRRRIMMFDRSIMNGQTV